MRNGDFLRSRHQKGKLNMSAIGRFLMTKVESQKISLINKNKEQERGKNQDIPPNSSSLQFQHFSFLQENDYLNGIAVRIERCAPDNRFLFIVAALQSRTSQPAAFGQGQEATRQKVAVVAV